jgi:hypothetical protein
VFSENEVFLPSRISSKNAVFLNFTEKTPCVVKNARWLAE